MANRRLKDKLANRRLKDKYSVCKSVFTRVIVRHMQPGVIVEKGLVLDNRFGSWKIMVPVSNETGSWGCTQK